MIHKPTSIKIDLTKLDSELNQPAVIALLEQGYTISATIPVDDNGTPTALCILTHPNTQTQYLTTRNISIIAMIAVTLQTVCLYTLHFLTT